MWSYNILRGVNIFVARQRHYGGAPAPNQRFVGISGRDYNIPIRSSPEISLFYNTTPIIVPQSYVVGAPPSRLHITYEPSSYSVICLSYNLEPWSCSDPMLFRIELMLFNIDLIYL